MKKITLLIFALAISSWGFAQPANDLCANAIEITANGSISGTTVGATTDAVPFCGTSSTSPGVWYRFTDTSGTGSTVDLSLCGGTSYDSKLSVYTGSCGSFSCVAGNDDSCGLQSAVNFTTDGSSTYYVLVHGFGGGTGTFNLSVSGFPGAPIGNPPVIACPGNISADTDPGQCTAIVNFADAIAFDIEDGPLTTTQTAGPASGSAFPVGDTTVEYSVTDSDGNTETCSFLVTVTDTEAPIAVCQDLTLDLDPVTGMVMIDPTDVDNGSTDNCGIVSYELGVVGSVSGTISTIFNSNNGGISGGAVYFNVTVGPEDLTLEALEMNTADPGAFTVSIYSFVGTYVGNTQNPAPWGSPVATATGTSAGEDNPSLATLGAPIILSANTTYAMALVMDATHGHDYSGSGASPAPASTSYSNADLSLSLGAANNTPFTSTTFSPRIWNGSLIYSIDGVLIPSTGEFDCDDIGTTDVVLTVTDAEGNATSCTSTVTIQDTTAPVIACVGEPATLTGSTTGTPGLAIVDNTTVSTTLNVTDDVTIEDLDIDLNITHTWTGDLEITLESPAGTQVVIFSGGADGCSANDIITRLDDESANVLDCDPIGGGSSASAFPEADYVPSNPLSAFDGESTAGNWILSIEDTAGGDQGIVNSFSLLYQYEVTAAPLDVVLDANGMATIDAADLILSVEEGCGFTVSVGGPSTGGGGTPQNLETSLLSDNGFNANWFDIVAVNDVTINSFNVNLATGTTDDVAVYYKSGSYVGFESDPSAWTLLGTATGVVSNGTDVATPLNLDLEQEIMAGETAAFHITTVNGGTLRYFNGTTTGALYTSDANIEFYEGAGGSGPFGTSIFSPRVFSGNILYTEGSPSSTEVSFDCSQLGENQIEVFVTDDSGNFSSCISTVNVIDETAPVLVCADTTIELGADGTATIDPMALLATTEATFEAMVIGSDNSSGSEGLTDFVVNVTDPVTITFDWDYTLNDIPGFDSFGYIVNGVYTQLTDPAIGNQNGNASVSLNAGDVFGFRSQTDDNSFGNNETIITNFTPGFEGQFAPSNWSLELTNSDGDAFFVEIPGGPLSFDACGIETLAVDVTEVSCADIGTPITVTVFASDASGNIASCQAVVTVVDALAPELTCPADQTVDPGGNNLFYEVPDYFATGEASALDNCTDPVTITTQDPAAGELIPDGTYTVTLTAEDEYGNVATCEFELTVESVLGTNSNELGSAIAMYPNPATNQVTLQNSSGIQLESAAIYDVSGKLVDQVDLRAMQGSQSIDISGLASGMYMVTITSEKASVVKRLVKE